MTACGRAAIDAMLGCEKGGEIAAQPALQDDAGRPPATINAGLIADEADAFPTQ
jgi:hypothetical protein